MGADAGLVITPYYNKPTPAGLYHHFRTLAEGVPDLPFVLYNVPSRTSVSFDVPTVERLADLPNIVALKEATGDLKFDAKLVSAVGDRMILLSGDDATALPLWCVGGRGLIAVITNLIPDRVVSMWQAYERGDLAGARRLHLQLMPLFEGLFLETSPGPVKAVLSWMEKGIRPDMRLPLVPIEPGTEGKLRALCEQLEVPLAQ